MGKKYLQLCTEKIVFIEACEIYFQLRTLIWRSVIYNKQSNQCSLPKVRWLKLDSNRAQRIASQSNDN